MRSVALLSIAVFVTLAGCTTSKSSDAWRDRQRARLERLHSKRSIDDALTDVLRHTPGLSDTERSSVGSRVRQPYTTQPETVLTAAVPSSVPSSPVAQDVERPQDPRHIDQRLPERVSTERSYRHSWQPLVASVDYGIGSVMARADGTGFNDRTDAAFARVRLDTGSGAALHVDWWGSDANLFAGRFMNDGVVPKAANAELGGADVFPHVRLDYRIGAVQVPVRVGLFADWQQLDHQQARVEREWMSFGPRIVVEPTWMMVEGQDATLQLFARIGADAGAAWFSEEFQNGDDSDLMPRWAGEIGGGVRGRYGAWHAELGYRLHHTTYGESQGSLFGSPGRTELQRQQVYFGFGVTY